MTRDDIRAAVLQALTSAAPEIDPQTLAPERDYGRLATPNGAIDYLAGQLPA